MRARAAVTDIMSSTRPEAARHGWRRLAILAALMGFAPISTDLHLPAIPAMGARWTPVPGRSERTISRYLIGFSFGQLLGPVPGRSPASRDTPPPGALL